MPHPEQEHSLRIQLATALREREEAIRERDRQLGCRNLAQKDRNAYELQNEELRKALAAARRECEARQTGCWHGDKGHPCALTRARELEAALRDALNAAHHHVQAGQHWICSEPFPCEEDCPCAAIAAPGDSK